MYTTHRTRPLRPPNSWRRGPPRVPSGGGFGPARAARRPRCEGIPMTAASRWIGPRRSRPSWDGERANEGPTATTCEFANGRMATPTATGGDTSPNRDGPLGTRDNVPDRATQLPPPPRCTGPGAPTATNRHFISVHIVNMTQFTVLVRRLSPKCSQFPSGDWLLFCTPRSVSVDTAYINTPPAPPTPTTSIPLARNTTPHHTTPPPP